MAEKTFNNVRLGLKIDTLTNWQSSSLVLRPGEVAFATVAASAGTGLTEPVIMAKIGTQESFETNKTFKDLDWAFHAKASDVLACVKSEEGLTAFIDNVIANSGLATDGAMTALTGRVTTAEGEIDTLQSEMDAVEAKAAANETAIGVLEGLVGDTEVATQIQNAIDLLDLENTYAEKVHGHEITDVNGLSKAISDAQAAAEGKATELNTAMNTRVAALEAIDHTHTFVESELNQIKAGDVAKWNAAEQNAKDYADDLDEVMDGRVAAIEAKFGNGEGNVESQIAAAVAAEAELREAADEELDGKITGLTTRMGDAETAIGALEGLVGDTAVATQISTAVVAEAAIARAAEEANADAIAAIEADYLVEADKTELQGNITALANGAVAANTAAIATLNGNAETDGSVDYKIAQKFATLMENPDEAMNSIQELVDWTTEHAADALEMSNQVTSNKNAIATLNGGADVAGSVAKQIADAIAAENLAQYATDSEMTAVTGRVTTVEGKVSTLEGEMDAVEGRATALEGLVGDTAVATQITTAVDGLKNGQLTTMQGEIDAVEGRATALEAKAHEHANKTVIDGIEAADITAWDAKVDAVTAAADSGLKAIRTGNSVAIEIDDTVTFIFDCGGAE